MRKYGVGHPTVQRALESAWPQPRKKLSPRATRPGSQPIPDRRGAPTESTDQCTWLGVSVAVLNRTLIVSQTAWCDPSVDVPRPGTLKAGVAPDPGRQQVLPSSAAPFVVAVRVRARRRPARRIGRAPVATVRSVALLLVGVRGDRHRRHPRCPGSSPGCCRSAWVREGAEPTDRVGDLFRPWPVAAESQAPLACGRDELGSGGEQPQPPTAAATGKSRSAASGSRQRDGGGAGRAGTSRGYLNTPPLAPRLLDPGPAFGDGSLSRT